MKLIMALLLLTSTALAADPDGIDQETIKLLREWGQSNCRSTTVPTEAMVIFSGIPMPDAESCFIYLRVHHYQFTLEASNNNFAGLTNESMPIEFRIGRQTHKKCSMILKGKQAEAKLAQELIASNHALTPESSAADVFRFVDKIASDPDLLKQLDRTVELNCD